MPQPVITIGRTGDANSAAVQNVCIDPGRLDIIVAQQFLNRANIVVNHGLSNSSHISSSPSDTVVSHTDRRSDLIQQFEFSAFPASQVDPFTHIADPMPLPAPGIYLRSIHANRCVEWRRVNSGFNTLKSVGI